MKKSIFLVQCVLMLLVSCKDDDPTSPTPKYKTLSGNAPLIIGHRGSPGLLPDHTLEGYAKAIEDGADFVEPDLVLTKDSVLIARHEPMLGTTTDVSEHSEFASRKKTITLDGYSVKDEWFASDFTLAEIKTLKAKQPLDFRPQQHNGKYAIPTFEEVIALVKQKSAEKGRTIGVYPETKHPSYHEDLKLHISDKLLEALSKAGLNSKDAAVYVQSFEVGNLQYINGKSEVKLVQLLDANDVKSDGTMDMTAPYGQPYDFVKKGDARTYNDLITDAGLDFIKTYADGIGPWKPYILPYKDGYKMTATTLINRAHAKGLVVHAYTFRNESKYLLKDYKDDPKLEYKDFFDLGVDGVFSDYPATAAQSK